MPVPNLERSRWARAALVVASRAFIAFVVLCTLAYVVRAAVPTVFADGWWFTDTFVRHYVDGQLGLADFFNKRGGFDHAQPVHRLVLFANLAWFDMDFTFEGLVGVLFGIAFFGLLASLVTRELRGKPHTLVTRELVLVGLAVTVFSFNNRDLFTWPLVTLVFVYLLGISLYFLVLQRAMTRRRPWPMFAATLLCCLLLDTSGVLAAAAGGALVAFAALRDRRYAAAAGRLAAIAGGVLLYRAGYGLLMPGAAGTPVDAAGQFAGLLGRIGEAWKLLLIPTGDALISTSRVHAEFGPPWVWPVAVPCALLVMLGHVWFWWRYAAHRERRLPFLAAGLMLFFYATLAGIVWARVPKQGFDYLTQPRYLVFYSLQVVAMLLMWAFLVGQARAADAPAGARPPSTAALAGGVGVLAGLALFFMYCVRYQEMGHLRWYELQIGRQILALGHQGPDEPSSCTLNRIEICSWPPQRRHSVIEVLRRGGLNVYSEAFVRRHRWTGKLAEDAP